MYRACQKLDWRDHKPACAPIAEQQAAHPAPAAAREMPHLHFTRNTALLLCTLCCALEPLSRSARLSTILASVPARVLHHLLSTLHALRLREYGMIDWQGVAELACGAKGAAPADLTCAPADHNGAPSGAGSGAEVCCGRGAESGGEAGMDEGTGVESDGEGTGVEVAHVDAVAASAAAGEGVAMLIHRHLLVRCYLACRVCMLGRFVMLGSCLFGRLWQFPERPAFCAEGPPGHFWIPSALDLSLVDCDRGAVLDRALRWLHAHFLQEITRQVTTVCGQNAG